MSNYPFDPDTTSYAYITAKTTSYGFGHVNLHINLPSLARTCANDWVTLSLTTQCSDPTDNANSVEPFYAVRFAAESTHMTAVNCERAAKALRKLEREIAKIDALAGSPAVLLEDLILRTIKALRIEHVYCAKAPNDRSSITDMQRFYPLVFDSLHSQIRHLKRETLKACGWFREAA